MPKQLTQEYVRELFDYDEQANQLIWKIRKSPRACVGAAVNPNQVNIDFHNYSTAKVIRLWRTGEWRRKPASNNASGVPGVHQNATGYRAFKWIGKIARYSKTFPTIEQAKAALEKFENDYRDRQASEATVGDSVEKPRVSEG